MSIIVSVKINDGIVMAADSATTFANGQIYENANKIVNLVKGLPIGVMTCGAGGIGNASMATLLKDLRQRLTGQDAAHRDWAIDSAAYTMESVSSRLHEFFAEKVTGLDASNAFLFRICGYSAGRPLPEVWQVVFTGGPFAPPTQIQSEGDSGPRWNGENEALDRLILGCGSVSDDALATANITREQHQGALNRLGPSLYEHLIMLAAPIQDAIDLSNFMVEVSKGFVRFAILRKKTVGGPTEIAVITKHEGFKWVQRKYFYDRANNPPADE